MSGLRGLAALAVFCMHAWYLAGQPDPVPDFAPLSAALIWLFRIGWSGVDVFFTLSGFLLALPFLREGGVRPGASEFLRRRWLRIFPAYYVQALLLFAVLWLWPELAKLIRPAPLGSELAAHALLWFYAWPIVQPWLATWWTLPVEFGFYLCLPWLVRLLAPGRWRWLVVLFALVWLWRLGWLLGAEPGMVSFYRVEQLPGRLDQFLIGMLAAWAWLRSARLQGWLRTHGRSVFLLSLLAFLTLPALWLLVHPYPHDAPSAHPLLLAWHSLTSVAVAGMILACCTSTSSWVAWLGSRPLRALGTVSYGLYLWHFPVLVLMRSMMRDGDSWKPEFWPFWAQSLLLSLALATLSYWLVERPCLRLGKAGKMQHESAG